MKPGTSRILAWLIAVVLFMGAIAVLGMIEARKLAALTLLCMIGHSVAFWWREIRRRRSGSSEAIEPTDEQESVTAADRSVAILEADIARMEADIAQAEQATAQEKDPEQVRQLETFISATHDKVSAAKNSLAALIRGSR